MLAGSAQSTNVPWRPGAEPPMLATLAIGVALAAFWVFLTTPAPDYFLVDPDGGLFLYGGWHTLRSGEQPQLDYLSHYGPLSYWLRSAALAITGQEPVAEVLLCSVGYVASYAALLWLLLRVCGNRAVVIALLSLALLAMPRFYKFPVILLPVLSLLAALALLESPTRKRAAALGAVTGITLLFRYDYGAAAASIGVLALGLVRPLGSTGKRGLFSAATIAMVAIVAPWLVALAWRPGLYQHLQDLWQSTSGVASGLGLPHPLLGSTRSHEFWMFAVFYALPALLLAAAALEWRARRSESAGRYALVAFAALAYLPQSAHRADEGHLLQVLAPSFVVLACLWWVARERRNGWSIACAALAFVAAASVVVWSAAERGSLRRHSLAASLDTWRATALRSRLYEAPATHPWSPGYVKVIDAIDRCTAPDERVAIFPYAHQIAYFAARLMPLPTFLLVPGYLDSVPGQRKVIAGLRSGHPALILWYEAFTFDEDPRRNPTHTHALVHEYVRTSHVTVGTVGFFTAYAPPERADAMARCISKRPRLAGSGG
jgi:hypothetical protein